MTFPERTPHSNHRHSPYPTAQNLHRSSSSSSSAFGFGDPDENSFRASQAGMDRSFSASPAPNPFAPSPARDFGVDLSNSFGSHSTVSTGTGDGDAAQIITKYGTQLGLDNARLRQAHQLNQYIKDPVVKISVAHVQGLFLAQQYEGLAAAIAGLQTKLDEVKEYVRSAWSLSPHQEETIKSLLGNYLMRPLLTYNLKKIIDSALSYIASHRRKFHLDHFGTDEVVQATIKSFCKSHVSEIRSGFRKALFKYIHDGLDVLADEMIRDFHFSPKNIDDKERTRIKAVLALQRKIALPLAARRKNKRGADTGFWKDLETQLKALAVTNGSDRSSAGWTAWEASIIQEDILLHQGNDNHPGDGSEEEEEADGGQ
ncbi:hypothetical protein C8R45DRAFT_1207910 [Mycena sanguinolenta]|nr:hypothetical protein C8R45DRAFT_1207910 [Mycena sanguinolenta]